MQTFQKPENALKRANELLSIGQQDAALRILHTAIGHRRFRSQGWDAVQEAIMLRHVQLCVDEGKLRLARDGLHQYRIISQHANTLSLGKVVAELRARAEAKLAAAKARAGDDVRLDASNAPEDLDVEAETPENLLLSTLQVEIRSPDARDVHQALRAEWDVYKIILDLLRTTPKLERVYHETARRAFQFCKENRRQQEFKRLCDVLRSHFALILKNRNKEDYDLLLRPELHLETRMQQLCVAAELELWRECSTTAEDIYGLGLLELFHRSLRSPVDLFHKSREKLLRWVALYYEKLSKVLWVGDNYLFHALAWVKFFLHVKGFKKSAAAEDLQAMASVAVLAVLAIPTDTAEKKQNEFAGDALSHPNYEQKKRLALLLGHGTVPTRDSLAAALRTKDILSTADATCQELFSLYEAEFTPLKLCSLCQPLLQSIAEKPLLQPYVLPLKRVVLQKLTEQLARVYVSLSIDYFTSNICSEDFLSWPEAEKLLVSLVHSNRRASSGAADGSSTGGAAAAEGGTVTVRIDYAAKAMMFETNDICPERLVRNNLVSLSKSLDLAVQYVQPNKTRQQQQQRHAYQQAMKSRLAAEAARMNERLRRTNLRRLEKQEEQQKLEEERRRREAEQRRVEEKQERDRREEASKRRVERRQQEERIKARSETAALVLDEIKRIGGKDSKIVIKGKQLGEINIQDVLEGHVDYDDLEKAQRLQLDKERLLRVRQRRLNFKKVCYFIRACREEELPLLEEWAKRQLEEDTKILMHLQHKHEEEHRAAFTAALEEKSAFECVREDKEIWIANQLQQRQQQFEAAAAEQRQRLLRMLQIQKVQRARERRDEAIRLKRQQEEQRRMEEEHKRYLEDMERQRAEEEAREKRLLEIAERQRQRELEIEAKHGLVSRESGGSRRGDTSTPSRKSESPVSSNGTQQTPPTVREQQQQRDTAPRFREQQQQTQLEWRRNTPLPTADRVRDSPPKQRDEPFIRRSDRPAAATAANAAGGETLNWRSSNRGDRQQQQQPPQQQQQQQPPQPPQQQQQTETPTAEDDGFTRVSRRRG